ncbi:ABC transporter ATP-binding protein [Aestuariivirga sp.]|uniref:ABC transporter ATP-binding protein n=1 Tax=Aestuariivirga sp. TaxID=2650926 RepID=UPI003BA9C4FF
MTALVAIEHVSHSFGAARVLDDVSLSLAHDSYTVLLGPSGSGKTTMLSILGGFIAPQQGRVLIKGEDCTAMAPAKRPTATVFQDYALFPHMSIGANVGFGLRMMGMARREREAQARAMLDVVGLSASFERKPHQLSGGQRQRVALARALVVQPAVLLLDEPLGALDLKLRRQMQDELKAIQRRVGTAFIHVTHDQEEAMALADHIVVMNHGRIEDQGPPERVYARPATRFTATFMGESTIVPGTAAYGMIDTPLGRFPAGLDARHVAIRPEHVTLGGPIAATVQDVVYQGSFKRVTAQAGETTLLARLPAAAAVSVGQQVMLAIDPAHVIVLKD